MIIPMTRYDFLLLNSDRENFISSLRDLGVVDITRSSKPVDEVSRSMLARIEQIRARIKDISNCSSSELMSLRTRRSDLARSMAEIEPWGNYDRDALRKLGAHFYICSPKQFDPSWPEEWPLLKVSESKANVWFVVMGDVTGFPLKEIPAPQKTVSELSAEIAVCDKAIEDVTKALEAKKPELPGMEKEIEHITAELEAYLADVSATDAAEGSVLVYTGFAPNTEDARLKEAFDGMDIYYTSSKATAGDNPPIKLRNSWFVRQFEVLTRMYGMPVYNEFDPSIFLSIFFLMFFAMCMGDAGYGILLIIIGLVLRKKSGSGGLADMWGLITILGGGTIVAGLIMGGFFGLSLGDMPWYPEWAKSIIISGDLQVGASAYSKQMVLSLAIGIVHICLAMLVKARWEVKRNGFKNSLGTLGWTLLIVGGIVALAIGLAGVIPETAMKWLLIGIAGVSALGIYFFNKWGRNPLVNFGAGLWDTYNTASGLMSDVLSYIRLYALGLSGGMLGSTFNQIGMMVVGDDPTWQWVPAVLIFVVGHVLNLALSCLGAFVHPLRLNFVEFFKNSGYEGMGTAYNPIHR